MHVYQCHYRGMTGYCCRAHNGQWMFVPELGQSSSTIHKQISLDDLSFESAYAKSYEAFIDKEKSVAAKMLNSLKRAVFPINKPATVGGGLFAPAA